MAGSSLFGARGEKYIHSPASASGSGFLARAVESLDLFQVASAMVACPRRNRAPVDIHDTEPQIQAPPPEPKATALKHPGQSDTPEKRSAASASPAPLAPLARSESESKLLESQLEAQLGNVVDTLAGKPADPEKKSPEPLPETAPKDPEPAPREKEPSPVNAAATTPSVAEAAALILDDASLLAAGKEPPARKKVTAPSDSVVSQTAQILDRVQAAASGTPAVVAPPDRSPQDGSGSKLQVKGTISQGTAERVDALLGSARDLVGQAIPGSPAQGASAPDWDAQVKALVSWHSNHISGNKKKKNARFFPVECPGCDITHSMRMREIIDRDPSRSLENAAFMAIKDVAMARSLETGFNERLNGKGSDALPLLSYEFMRMLQIRSQEDHLDAFFVAMWLVKEMRGEEGLEIKKGKESSQFIGEVLPIKRILPKMLTLARGVYSGGFLDIPHESSDPLSKGEEDQLLEAYRNAPIASLAVIRDELLKIPDPQVRLEYVRASVALELTLDSVIWQPDNIIRDSVPDYVMHGFYDFGMIVDFRERLKADKFEFARHLVDVKSKTLDLVASGHDKARLMGTEEWIAIYLAGQVKSHVNDQNMHLHGAPPPGAMDNGKRTVGAGAYFDNGGGICRHNTLIYSLFLQELGISNWMLKGNVEKQGIPLGRHALNAVRLDGKWHAIDITQGITSPHHIPVNLDSMDVRNSTMTLPFHYGNFKLDMANNKWAVKKPRAAPIQKKQE